MKKSSLIVALILIAIVVAWFYMSFKYYYKEFDYDSAAIYMCECVNKIDDRIAEFNSLPPEEKLDSLMKIQPWVDSYSTNCIREIESEYGANFELEKMRIAFEKNCPVFFKEMVAGRKHRHYFNLNFDYDSAAVIRCKCLSEVNEAMNLYGRLSYQERVNSRRKFDRWVDRHIFECEGEIDSKFGVGFKEEELRASMKKYCFEIYEIMEKGRRFRERN